MGHGRRFLNVSSQFVVSISAGVLSMGLGLIAWGMRTLGILKEKVLMLPCLSCTRKNP